MDALVHIANLLILVSFSLKDILWLRVLNIVASVFFVSYFLLQDPQLLVLVAWNVLFTGVNIYQIIKLWRERRPVILAPREARVHAMAFGRLSPRQFQQLMTLAQWQHPQAAQRLVAQGEALDQVMFIADGEVEVRPDGAPAPIALGEGQFIGEMSFLTGQPPGADVHAGQETTLVTWPHAALRTFLSENETIRSALQTIIGHDLVRKLRRA